MAHTTLTDAMHAVLRERYDELRDKFGMTDKALAAKPGLSLSAVQRHFGKRGDRNVPDLTVSQLEAFCAALELDPMETMQRAYARMR